MSEMEFKATMRYKCMRNGTSVDELAIELGINRATMYRRLTTREFTRDNLRKIYRILHLTQEEFYDMFLDDDDPIFIGANDDDDEEEKQNN